MAKRNAPLWAAALALFCLYLYSAYPALSPYRDSGDLAAAALTLGVAHPPGYPLYLVLAKVWLLLFRLGNPAFRLHVFSALAGAAAALVLALAARRALDEGPGGDGGELLAGAAASFVAAGLAPSFWHLSLVSEMYSLNALVGAVLLWLVLPGPAGEESSRRRRLCLAAMLFGLGLGNHQTLLAAAPGLALACRRPAGSGNADEEGLRRRAAVLAGFCLLGLLLYAYLPVRSAAGPAVDWGEPRTPRNLWRVLTRADYGGVRLHPDRAAGFTDLAQTLASLRFAGRLFLAELGWPGAALALWGAWAGRRRPAAPGCLAAFAAAGPVFLVWANLDPAAPETYAILEPHLVLPLVFAAALAGMGAADLWRRCRGRTPGARPAVLAPALASLVLAAAWGQARSRDALARLESRLDFTAWDYGKGLAASLPKDALVLDPDDPTAFTLSYLAAAHSVRTDVVPLLYFRTWWGYDQIRRRHPELLPPGRIDSGQVLLATLVAHSFDERRPLYTDLPQKAPAGTEPLAAGLAYRLVKGAAGLDDSLGSFHSSVSMQRLLFRRPAPPHADFFSRHTVDYWSVSLNNLGIQAQGLRWPEEAVALYRRALALTPDLPEAWNNLANVLLAARDANGAEGCYRLSLLLKPAPQVVYNLGRVYLLAGKYGLAESTFQRAIAAGGPPDARNDLGLLYLRTDRVREAVDAWRSLLADYPGYGLAYYNLALACEKLGRKAEAAEALETYLRFVRDPAELAETEKWLARLKKS